MNKEKTKKGEPIIKIAGILSSWLVANGIANITGIIFPDAYNQIYSSKINGGETIGFLVFLLAPILGIMYGMFGMSRLQQKISNIEKYIYLSQGYILVLILTVFFKVPWDYALNGFLYRLPIMTIGPFFGDFPQYGLLYIPAMITGGILGYHLGHKHTNKH